MTYFLLKVSPAVCEGVNVDTAEVFVGLIFGGLFHAYIGTIAETGGQSLPIELVE